MTPNLYVRLQHCNEKSHVTFPSHIYPFNVPNRPTIRTNAMRNILNIWATYTKHITPSEARAAVASREYGSVTFFGTCESVIKWYLDPFMVHSCFLSTCKNLDVMWSYLNQYRFEISSEWVRRGLGEKSGVEWTLNGLYKRMATK